MALQRSTLLRGEKKRRLALAPAAWVNAKV